MADDAVAELEAHLEQLRKNKEDMKKSTRELCVLQAKVFDTLVGSNGNKPYPYKKKE
jgi:hypothetical protein